MGITNSQTGTKVQEVADGIHRVDTPIAIATESGPVRSRSSGTWSSTQAA